ncbi:MAG TPA: hypothetical protein VFL17_11830 [Anaerolineae bacterium]|nr:hypothetical protein [Anaerolineae bacterium]
MITATVPGRAYVSPAIHTWSLGAATSMARWIVAHGAALLAQSVLSFPAGGRWLRHTSSS